MTYNTKRIFKTTLKKIPILGGLMVKLHRAWHIKRHPFTSSAEFWKEHYHLGGDSGPGSYGKLSRYKADIINRFVKDEKIKTVIEYGCGDGNQLQLAEYGIYLGFDISHDVIKRCKNIFNNDQSKKFKLTDDYNEERAELTLSLDVLYHLVEDRVYSDYMNRLFDSSDLFVMIYSSDYEDDSHEGGQHVRHRKNSRWIEENKPGWILARHIKNKYEYKGDPEKGSLADFYIYKKQ